MGGSTADTPTTPESLRASDAERDQAIDELRNEFAEGRLSHETFMYRMQTALGAQNHGQLASLFTDLPPRRTRLPERIRAAWRGLRRQAGDERVLARQGPQQAQRPQRPDRPQGPQWMQVPQGMQVPHGPGPHGAPAPVVLAPLFFPPGSGIRFTIGRTHDCDLRLADLSVSRRHAELTRDQDGWLLNDLGSHNGTRLNGWLIREPVPVRAGDRVEFGSAMFIIQDGGPAEEVPPPSGIEPSGIEPSGIEPSG